MSKGPKAEGGSEAASQDLLGLFVTMARHCPPRAREAPHPRWASKGRPGPLGTGLLGSERWGDLGSLTQEPGCRALEAELGFPVPVCPHQPVFGGPEGDSSSRFSGRGRRWPAPRDPGGAAGQGWGGVGKPGGQGRPGQGAGQGLFSRDTRPCRERRGVAAAPSRGEALLSFPCHPPVMEQPPGRWPCPGWVLAVPFPSGVQDGVGPRQPGPGSGSCPIPSRALGEPGGGPSGPADGGLGGGAAWADGPTVRTDGGPGRAPEPAPSAPGPWWGFACPPGAELGGGPGLLVFCRCPFGPRALGWVSLPRAALGSCSPFPAAVTGPVLTELEGFPSVSRGSKWCPGRTPGTG